MQQSQPDPLLAYRNTSEFLVVLALYEQLHDSFCGEFGEDAAPEYSIDKLGERIPNLTLLARSPGRLLPVHNGWAYSPEWVAPLRLDEQRLNPLPISHLEDDNLPEQAAALFVLEGTAIRLAGENPDSGELFMIEQRIYERAWILDLLQSASNLLDEAISKAHQDVVTAAGLYQQRLVEAAEDTPEATRQFKDRRQALCRAEVELRLLRLRLHWLGLWNNIEKRRKKVIRGRKVSQLTQIQRVIQPKDVLDAYAFIDHVLNEQRKPEAVKRRIDWILAWGPALSLPEILIESRRRLVSDESYINPQNQRSVTYGVLGLWYANTLYKCGASAEELEQLLSKAGHFDQPSDQPPSWHQVVRKIYANALTLLDRTPEPKS